MEKNSKELHEIIVTAEIKITIASKNHIFEKCLSFLELSEYTEWDIKFHNFWCVISELF